MPSLEEELAGPTPFFLVLELDEGQIGIDLDSPWEATHADDLDQPGTWWLFDKSSSRAIFALVVEPGDRPYFVKQHIFADAGMPRRELLAYGMGKERADGTVVRMWILPNGVICGGDDAYIIAARMLGDS